MCALRRNWSRLVYLGFKFRVLLRKENREYICLFKLEREGERERQMGARARSP